jgi:hypothetical protein
VLTNPSAGISDGRTPENFVLNQNFPNPFNPSTKIQFTVPEISHVKIKVYDVLGKEISTLVNGEFESGTYSINFSGNGIPSGVYFYRIEAVPENGKSNYYDIKKMVLLR